MMRLKLRFLFIAFVLSTLSNAINAATVSVDQNGIRYTVDLETNEAEVYGTVSYLASITDLVIPDFIEHEGEQIPVTAIADRAFKSNPYLRGSLTIGNNVRTIGDEAFYFCQGFTSLTIGDNVRTIGDNAFENCYRLTGSLTIPNSVQTIGNYAFQTCWGFTGSLTIPDNVETIGEGAFAGCTGFTGSLTIGNSVQTIGNYAFYECKGFTGSLTIPDNVQTIGEHAFNVCDGFTGSLTIGNSVQTIGGYAFANCTGFTGSLIIPDNVQTIEDLAFIRCTGFTGSLTIGNNVRTIGYCAFADCTGFTGSLVIPDNVEEIGKSAFYGCKGFTGSLTIPDNVQTIGESAFNSCSGFTGSLTIGNNVQTIGINAFANCTGFTGSLIIPDNVQTIGYGAFQNCTGFTGSLTIGKNVETIENLAFNDCSGFTGELVIPESVKEIGHDCFGNCKNFSSLVITSSNTIINFMAFVNNYGLMTITCLAPIPPKCEFGYSGPYYYDYVFGGTSYSKPLYVPAESINLYKNADEWKKFNNINPITVEVTDISINKTELTLLIGQEETLIATLTPEGTTSTIIWKSDNEAVATVGEDGTVTAVSVGTANITATCGEATATCIVAVINEPDEPDVMPADTPAQLLRKGDGTSHTFVAMMEKDDEVLEDEGYRYVFGYTNLSDGDISLGDTPWRYTYTTEEIYWDSANDFWVFSYYIDNEGALCVSSRRHLDGTVDDGFDPMDFIGSKAQGSENIIAIYTIEGKYVGKNIEVLESGIYVVKTPKSSYKIIK